MKKVISAVSAALVLGLLASCASTSVEKDSAPAAEKPAKAPKEKAAKEKAPKAKKVKFDPVAYKAAIETGDYESAIGMIEGLKEVQADKMIDRGIMELYLGNYDASGNSLYDTSKLMAGLVPDVSDYVKLKFASGDYLGNFYENILVDVFQALALYNEDPDRAYPALKAVYEKCKRNYQIYGDALKQESEKDDEDEKKAGGDSKADGLIAEMIAMRTSPDFPRKLSLEEKRDCIYTASALGDYLFAVVSKICDNPLDEAVVAEFKQLAPKFDTTAFDVKADKGRLEVLSLNGSIATREQKAYEIKAESYWRDMIYSFTKSRDGNQPLLTPEQAEDVCVRLIPKLKTNINYPSYVDSKYNTTVNVTVKDAEGNVVSEKKAALLEDFDVAVEKDVKFKARKTAMRNAPITITSKIAVSNVQLVLYVTAYSTLDALPPAMKDKALEKAVDKLMGAMNKIEPRADIRQANALPSKAKVAGFDLAPGKYTVEVAYTAEAKKAAEDGTKETATETKVMEVEVVAGKPTLVESVWYK